MFDSRCACECVWLCVCVWESFFTCACVSLFKETRPGCWHPEKSVMVVSEGICTHGPHTNTHSYTTCSRSLGCGRGLSGELYPVDVGGKRAKCRTNCWTERSVIRARHSETSYRPLWFWAVRGRSVGRHPSECMPAPAAHTRCIFWDHWGSASHSPLLLPPEHWGDLLSPSRCKSPGHRHANMHKCHKCNHNHK